MVDKLQDRFLNAMDHREGLQRVGQMGQGRDAGIARFQLLLSSLPIRLGASSPRVNLENSVQLRHSVRSSRVCRDIATLHLTRL